MSLHAFFHDQRCQLAELSRHLDGLADRDRVVAVQALTRVQQEQLWLAAEGSARLSPADFVSEDDAEFAEVIHWGRNSLPLFSRFQKRLARRCGAEPQIWGYNEQALKALTGPGYFVLRASARGELDDHGVVIDYTMAAPAGLPGWPAQRPNDQRLSRFIYHGTRDYLRRVSRHVVIGRVSRHGTWLPNWFVLVREDAAAGIEAT